MSGEKTVCTGGASIHDGLRAIGVDSLGRADQVQRLRDRVAELESERDASEFGRKSAIEEMGRLRERADKALVRAEAAEAERAAELKEQLAGADRAALHWKEQSESQQAMAFRWRAKYEAAGRELSACREAGDGWMRQAQCERIKREAAEEKYEALLSVARVPPSVLDYANGARGVGRSWFDAADFIRRLADATKPEPPKRKTRFQAALDHYLPIYGVCDEDMLREGLVAAGVDPDEELPEVAK